MTNDLVERVITHLRGREANRQKNEWVMELRMNGIIPICRTLEVCQSERQAREQERKWIAAFLEIGEPLYNVERIGKR